jgi:hypothetical protein
MILLQRVLVFRGLGHLVRMNILETWRRGQFRVRIKQADGQAPAVDGWIFDMIIFDFLKYHRRLEKWKVNCLTSGCRGSI